MFRPGTDRARISPVCECCAPKRSPAAADGADDQRRLDLAAHMKRCLAIAVDDLVEADAEEVGEHDLGDRPVAGDGEAERRADECRSQRSAYRAPAMRPELLEQAPGRS